MIAKLLPCIIKEVSMDLRINKLCPAKNWVGVIFFFILNSALFADQIMMNVSCQTYPSPYLADWANNPGIVKITIIYTGTIPDTVRLEGEAVSREHGEIVSGQSANIIFTGPQTIQRDNRDFLNYRNIEYSERYAEQLTRTGRLLEGIYTLNMKLVKVNTGVVVAEGSCIFYILSFSPPALVTPESGDTIFIATPTFQWTPATSHPGFTVRYHLKICEMSSGQTPQVAINNIAHHEQVIDNATTFIYPNTARPLEANKIYVWQVQARDRNDIPIGENEGKSETWRFQKAEILSYHPVMHLMYRPRIEITRTVNRINNYFEVILEIANQDTLTFRDLTIYSMNLGFQGRPYCWMRKRNADGTWPEWHGYLHVGTITNNREGNKFQWQGRISRLEPDSVLQIKYHLSPVLFSVSESPREYTICDSFRITLRVQDREYLIRPARMRYTNAVEVNNAFHAADYLIVTCPSKLCDHNPSTDTLVSADTVVNRLLGTMAELAELKKGVLGYIPHSWDEGNLKREISPGQRWATSMCPGWAEGNGYLLIVGETEIVPSFEVSCHIHFGGNGRCPICGARNVDAVTRIRITDYPYADTRGDAKPELKVGRIIGENARELLDPINASINVSLGRLIFDRSRALLVSGYEGIWEMFIVETERLGDILSGQRVAVEKAHTEYTITTEIGLLREALVIRGDYRCLGDPNSCPCGKTHPPMNLEDLHALITVREAENIERNRRGWPRSPTYGLYHNFSDPCAAGDFTGNWVKERAVNKDIIIWSGHGGPGGWAWVLNDFNADNCPDNNMWVELPGNPLRLGTKAPVVFAASCLTGNYEAEEERSGARAFLRKGAAIYIGSTEASPTRTNAEMTKVFFRDYWNNTTTSVGEAFTRFKCNKILDGDAFWPFTCKEYNLYGDPKFPVGR